MARKASASSLVANSTNTEPLKFLGSSSRRLILINIHCQKKKWISWRQCLLKVSTSISHSVIHFEILYGYLLIIFLIVFFVFFCFLFLFSFFFVAEFLKRLTEGLGKPYLFDFEHFQCC